MPALFPAPPLSQETLRAINIGVAWGPESTDRAWYLFGDELRVLVIELGMLHGLEALPADQASHIVLVRLQDVIQNDGLEERPCLAATLHTQATHQGTP